MSLLARQVTLHPDEILHSFVSRLAAANGASNVSEFRGHFELGSESDVVAPKVLAKLSELSGLSVDLLASHHIRREGGWAWIRDQQLIQTSVTSAGLRYCAHCVSEDIHNGRGKIETRPYLRAAWAVAHNSVCRKHGRFLSPLENLDKRYRWDFSLYYRDHRSEIEASADQNADAAISAYDIYFASRLEGAATDEPLLDPIPYYMAVRLSEIVGGLSRFQPKVRKLDFGAADAREVSCDGFAILQSRERFLDFLTTLNIRYANRSERSYKGFALYGNLQQYLTDNLDCLELRPMIDMVRKHAMDALPIGPEDPFIGGGGERRWHTILTASKANEIHPKLYKKTLIELGVVDTKAQDQTYNRVIIGVEEATNVAKIIRDGISIQEVRKRLGLQEHIVRDLMERGILIPAFGKAIGQLRQFSRKQVDAMMDGIINDLEQRREDKVNRPILKAIRHAGCNYADIIAALLEGKLKRCYISENGTKVGFERLLVDVTEVASIFLPERKHLTRGESQKALKTTDRTINYLIDHGYIVAEDVINPCTRLRQKLVRPETLYAFDAEYISLGQLAEGWTHFVTARNELAKKGIRPVIDSHLKYVSIYYRRSEVSGLRP